MIFPLSNGTNFGPFTLGTDNEPEFIAQKMVAWAAEQEVTLAYIQPGKPAQNALIERFNRTFREEVLDAHLFHSVEEAQSISEDWLEEYNVIRPHAALGGAPPYRFSPTQP